MTFVRHVLRFRDIDSLSEAATSPSNLLLSRQDAIPAVCYDGCDGAYKIALSQGKTPALCAPGSAFVASYMMCTSCVQDNSDSTKNLVRDLIEPEFQQFLDYCDSEDSTPTTTTINSDILASTVKTVVDSSGEAQTSVVIVTIITTDEVTSTTATPCSICTPLIYTDTVGTVHTVMVKPGLKDLPKTESAPSQTSPADEPKPSGSNSNKAVIIGPVVAVVVVILVLLAALFFWRRRRPKKNISPPEDPPQEEPKYEKAQLHSDCIPRGPQYELEGSVPPVPSLSPAMGEMTANEVAAQEMPTSQNCLAENDETEDNTPRQRINESEP
ncbi:hypothetical protein BKA56DRAFT_581370 [Ilyonectria sp. MPI-CAGE-AT-0026]|nr:hypothetical protein BKA56DRAFT_581370 [Ilyonectria sp. MPI-CAGE-AT-0026]